MAPHGTATQVPIRRDKSTSVGHVQAGPWCSWLARRPVKPEVAGSSPVGPAISFHRSNI